MVSVHGSLGCNLKLLPFLADSHRNYVNTVREFWSDYQASEGFFEWCFHRIFQNKSRNSAQALNGIETVTVVPVPTSVCTSIVP